MLPYLMVLIGLVLSLLWKASIICPLFGIPIFLSGVILYRQIYNRGNLIYWQWRKTDQLWKIALDKRNTILDRMTNTIESFSGFEGKLLRDFSADRNAAMFLMQSFPTIETMAATRDLYREIVRIEEQINSIRQDTAAWNKEIQQMGTDTWFNLCLPSYVRNRLNPILSTPEGDLNPAPDPGLANINTRRW